VRVTGGRYRGRRLQVPPRDIRPVTDHMREALFNVLAARGVVLDGCRFLDLFSGSGIMAVEAASRGAAHVDLVERDPRKRPYLQRNTSFVAAAVGIHVMPCERFLARARRAANGGWDLVFVDPPYAYRRKADLLAALAAGGGLRAGALVIVHTPAGEELAAPPRLPCVERRRYGGAALALFAAAEPEPERTAPDHP
jgi:16S rRNA (guanine(966)-N(2))-methyltransferase RsmD